MATKDQIKRADKDWHQFTKFMTWSTVITFIILMLVVVMIA